METFIEYKELLNDVFELERKLFLKMDSYSLIEKNCSTKCFNPDEIKQLSVDIHYVFVRLIRIMKNACPDLTEEDILFCCLKKSGLDNLVIGYSMGIASRQAINQRKYRIKKKMKAANCDYLFELIFASDS
jgi:hypothetical protein